MPDSAYMQGNAFLLHLPWQKLVGANSLISESQSGFHGATKMLFSWCTTCFLASLLYSVFRQSLIIISVTQEKFKTLIVGCLLQKYGHFCSIHTSSSLLHVLSSTSVDVTYKRGKNNSGFFHICFSYQAGKPQKEQDQVSADSASTGLLHTGGKKSSGPPIVTASQFSTPSTGTAKGNRGVHRQSSVVCHWCSGHNSHSKATILPT